MATTNVRPTTQCNFKFK